jgi:RNA polymerase sigma factor (sigma-70 family)
VAPADLNAFCEAEWPRLVGALSLYTGDPELAQDLAQETIARVCRHWPRVRRFDAPDAWAHRVARNLAHSDFRRLKAASRAAVRQGLPRSDVAETADVLAMRAAVAALPPRECEAIVARFFLGYSVRETAHALGCPEGTVKTHVHRAINHLREAGLIAEEALDG